MPDSTNAWREEMERLIRKAKEEMKRQVLRRGSPD